MELRLFWSLLLGLLFPVLGSFVGQVVDSRGDEMLARSMEWSASVAQTGPQTGPRPFALHGLGFGKGSLVEFARFGYRQAPSSGVGAESVHWACKIPGRCLCLQGWG